MLNIDKVKQVYLAVGVTDLRKSIDGLSAIAAVSFKLDVYENVMFVFCNRKRNRIKVLHWDNGFWLYYYRVERGRLQWSEENENGGSIGITMEEFKWILKGYEARTVNKLNMEKGGKIY